MVRTRRRARIMRSYIEKARFRIRTDIENPL